MYDYNYNYVLCCWYSCWGNFYTMTVFKSHTLILVQFGQKQYFYMTLYLASRTTK
jgi:hypothetical protein